MYRATQLCRLSAQSSSKLFSTSRFASTSKRHLTPLPKHQRNFHTSNRNTAETPPGKSTFPVLRSPYAIALSPNPSGFDDEDDEDIPWKERVQTLRKELPGEIRKTAQYYKQEYGEKHQAAYLGNPALETGDMEILYKFDSQEAIDEFRLGADSLVNCGHSTAELVLSPRNTAIFRGNLDTTLPEDGVTSRAGWTAMRSKTKERGFKYIKTMSDWDKFTHLVIKCRGDGRTYMAGFGSVGPTDMEMFDIWVYPLFTHGGPYWQVVKIPFSKFYVTQCGRIVRLQRPFHKAESFINSVAIMMQDTLNGPFQLEIDYIGLMYDASHFETFAYELYHYDTWVD